MKRAGKHAVTVFVLLAAVLGLLPGAPRCASAQSAAAPQAAAPVPGPAPAQVTAPSTAHAGAPAAAPHAAVASACIACHSDLARVVRPELRDPVAAFEDDIHRERGLSCHDCHGGKPDVDVALADAAALAHAKTADFRGRPAPADVPAFCGRCHSDPVFMGRFSPDARVDQVAKYDTSVHGQRLKQGDVKVANCISCHGRHPGGEKAAALAHGIRPAADPLSAVYPINVSETCGRCHADAAYMQEYGIPTDQLENYNQSVHHEQMVAHDDLSAPTCNDCHGNHGAHPPSVEDTSFVCGTCHMRQAELFRQSTMKPAFDELGLGECIVCHSNHRIVRPHDDMLFHAPLAADASPTGCYTCHADAEDPALLASTGIWTSINGLDARIALASATIADAGEKGMPVSDAEFKLLGATDALVESRALVHLFRAPDVEQASAKGLAVADEALDMGKSALEDFFFRHRWLGVSLVGIAVVILALVLKVRQVDRRWRASVAPGAPHGGRD